ncbi:unnamed protein product, partial [Adineta steineri]
CTTILLRLSSITIHCVFFPSNTNLWLEETVKNLNSNVISPVLQIWVGENKH